MSKIIIIFNGSVDSPLLGQLHKMLDQPLSEVKSLIASNKPIVEVELFERDHSEIADLLRGVIYYQ